MSKSSRQALPNALKHLISQTVALWGSCLKDIYGVEFFNEVEALRVASKKIASKPFQKQATELEHLLEDLRKKKSEELHLIAQSFGLMLELMNRCETAYRTTRLEERVDPTKSIHKSPCAFIYVFTAHPTEARSEEVLKLFKIIEQTLHEALLKGFEAISQKLEGYLKLAVKISMVKRERPSVEDEATSIYRYALAEDILQLQCEMRDRELTLHFRSWVGGDKDGHPGVDEKTLLMSLSHSRAKIADFLTNKFNELTMLLQFLGEKESKILIQRTQNLVKKLNDLIPVREGDGKRVLKFKDEFQDLVETLKKKGHGDLIQLSTINNLMWIYPALVLPLEIREDSELVMQALDDKSMAIARMLKSLKDLSAGFDPRWYVRGFVLSMCEEAEHLKAGNKLLKQIFSTYPIPVIPLFENKKSLDNGTEILKHFFKDCPDVLKEHKTKREGRYEIMLGYSDSSKENGVLSSRVLIYDTLNTLDEFLTSMKLTPVFFHGSGGSVERGGGSIKEQIAWWPESALNIYKVTVQGEMVARTLANRSILKGQVDKIIEEFDGRKQMNKKGLAMSTLREFANQSGENYRALVESESFWDLIEKATPYEYLDLLKIGSRPSKRGASSSRKKLRAIPWVLCWTQVRLLLPTWWGVGSAWENLEPKGQLELMRRYRKDPFLQSFAKSFGFTLKKVEMGIFELYLNQCKLAHVDKDKWKKSIAREFKLALKFLEELTGETELIWERPWLSESISLRSPNITPLNLIQVIALERSHEHLLRESVTGIATGMLTTG